MPSSPRDFSKSSRRSCELESSEIRRALLSDVEHVTRITDLSLYNCLHYDGYDILVALVDLDAFSGIEQALEAGVQPELTRNKARRHCRSLWSAIPNFLPLQDVGHLLTIRGPRPEKRPAGPASAARRVSLVSVEPLPPPPLLILDKSVCTLRQCPWPSKDRRARCTSPG